MLKKDIALTAASVLLIGAASTFLLFPHHKPVEQPQIEEKVELFTPLQYTPLPPPPVPAELVNVQVPILHDCRVYNHTGRQCVYCAAETLGNYHNVEGTKGLTDEYLGLCDPAQLNHALTKRKVKFKQVFGQNVYDFIEEWVTNKKLGVGIDVYGRHVVTCIHFERGKCVKVIDNMHKDLHVTTWTWQEFLHKNTHWAFVIFPDDYDVNVGLEENALDVQWPYFVK